MRNIFIHLATFFVINYVFCYYAFMSVAKTVGLKDSIQAFIPYYFLILYLRFRDIAPSIFDPAMNICFAGLVVSIFTILFFKKIAEDPEKNLTSRGTAGWASVDQIRKKKLLSPVNKPKDGVIVGAWDHRWNYEKRLKVAEFLAKISGINKWTILKFIPGSRNYIVDNEKTHILMCAPSRSGKGIGVVIPTCLNWQESMVVADPKGENIDTCGAYLEKVLGHKVIKFDPAESGNFYRWNPLNEIRWATENEGRDISALVHSLVGSAEGSEAHWLENAKDLIIGVITHLKYKDTVYNTVHDYHPGDDNFKETSMYSVYQFLSAGMTADTEDDEEQEDPSAPTGFRKVLKEELFGNPGNADKGIPPKAGVKHFPNEGVVFEVPNPYGTSEDAFIKIRITPEKAPSVTHFSMEALKTPNLHPVVVAKFNSFIGKPANEAGSVLSTAITALMIFSEKTIIDNTITSDFYLRDVRNSNVPVDLFLVTPPSDLQRVGKLFRLIVELMVVKSTQKLTGDKYRCLFLIDEFPAFGKMDTLVRELGYIAGYGLKTLIIIQGLEQIDNIYKSQELLTNCQTQIFFGPNDNKTREYVSKTLGKKTILLKQRSSAAGIFSKRNYTYLEQERALLLPDETSSALWDKSAMLIEGLRILSPKNKFFLMQDMMKKINDGHALDPKHQVGLRPMKGGEQNG